MNGVSRVDVEAAVEQLDMRLLSGPRDVSLLFDRAQYFELLGRKDEALHDYVEMLAQEPTHVDALNAVGLLCLSAGNRTAARTLLQGAVLHGPGHAAAHANLAYVYVLADQLAGARALYERALELEPQLAIAHHGLAELLRRTGDERGAEFHRSLGLQYRPVTLARFTGTGKPIHLLSIGTAVLGNIAADVFLTPQTFAVASLTAEHYDPSLPLPPHDLIVNLIAESDLCAAPLEAAAAIVRRSTAPVINDPQAVARTSRAANAQRIGLLEDVITPRMQVMPRDALVSASNDALAAQGFAFPILVRSLGFHAGEHFVKINRAQDLRPAIADLPGAQLLAIEFHDVRDRLGNARKYRVISVDGTLYPLHLAISQRWKVHYFSADMAASADHRAEDAAFLKDMPGVLGATAIAALERVRDCLALDYAGIDFALAADGRIIVFEANASMIVPVPDADPMWDYRREPVARIHTAVHAMLVARAADQGGGEPLQHRAYD